MQTVHLLSPREPYDRDESNKISAKCNPEAAGSKVIVNIISCKHRLHIVTSFQT